ncbi:hypothetical protein Tco_0716711 [Tanacetum coccineum]
MTIWSMKMEHYSEAMTNYPIWEIIQKGNGPVQVSNRTHVTNEKVCIQKLLRRFWPEKERKARTTLLMAIPEDHLAKFHKMTDAKEMWEAIKSRFGGNDESKKMQKYILKQQFESFSFGFREMDLKWQVVMISIRLKKFYKKTGRRLQFDAKEPVGFDKTKVLIGLVMARMSKRTYALNGLQTIQLNTEMSTRDKSGLGPMNDRFAKVEGMHAVPPPMTGNYMPPKSDFGIDESNFTYGPKQSKTSESDAKTSDFDSCETNSNAQTRFEAASKSPKFHLSQEVTRLEVGRTNLTQLSIHQMATLEFCDKYNMVAYLEKPEGTTSSTNINGEVELTASIDGQAKTITKAYLRRHLKLEDSGGITSLPNTEIFEQLALIGYATDSDKLTFQKETSDDISLFSSMITAPDTSPSRITSSPSLSPQHTSVSAPSTSPPPITETLPSTEDPAPIPHESPLQSVHSLGRDKGSVSLNELMDLVTQLTNKVGGLENELKNTKKVYGTAITKLAKRVKKLEIQVKTGKASRRTKIVLSEDEAVEEDTSK